MAGKIDALVLKSFEGSLRPDEGNVALFKFNLASGGEFIFALPDAEMLSLAEALQEQFSKADVAQVCEAFWFQTHPEQGLLRLDLTPTGKKNPLRLAFPIEAVHLMAEVLTSLSQRLHGAEKPTPPVSDPDGPSRRSH